MDLLKWELKLSLDFFFFSLLGLSLIVTIIGAKTAKTRGSESE